MKIQMELVRLECSNYGTFGVLLCDGAVQCVTLEPPDKGNQKNVSSIPLGQYRCVATKSARFGSTFEICKVPERSHILFHAGNTVADTSGCVLLGQGFGEVGGQRGIVSSRKAIEAFLQILDGCRSFQLNVRAGKAGRVSA